MLEEIEVAEHLFGSYVIGRQERISIREKGLRVGTEFGRGDPDLRGDAGVAEIERGSFLLSQSGVCFPAEPGEQDS